MAERVDVQRNVLMRLAQSRFCGIDLLRGVSASAIAGPIAGEYRPTVCRLPSPKGANEAGKPGGKTGTPRDGAVIIRSKPATRDFERDWSRSWQTSGVFCSGSWGTLDSRRLPVMRTRHAARQKEPIPERSLVGVIPYCCKRSYRQVPVGSP
jgi:hypothetical protein